MADLDTPLVKLLGGPTANKLAKARDVHTVGDLFAFLPRRYLDPATKTDFSTLTEGEYTVLVATVKSAATRPMRQRRGMMLTVTVTDGTRDLTVAFFRPYGHEARLVPGRTGLFAGKVQRYGSTWQLAHPNYELFETEDTDAALGVYAGGLVPVYLHVPKLDSWAITKSLRIVFDHLDEIDDPVPAEVRRERGLVPLLEAYRLVHLPKDRADVRRGQHRLRYDEAFTLQAVLAQRRRANADVRTTARRPRPGGLLESFDKRLPFELTAGQVAVSEQIAAELATEHPMHRLLQGEVGSGKTIVALRAMLSVIDSGGQAALLAPTEVLAAQHFRSMRTMLGDLAEGGMLGGSDVGTQVTLLTGSQPTAVRRKALLDAASGEAGIVIGTHALIQEHVSFFDLGLVVVDEQHRFGVEQREALRSKGSQPPHVLVMTATPIPRTVAMTVFGDMETSTLTELPRGRSPITSHVVPVVNPKWVRRTWQRVAEEVREGHQAYVVCPRIGDDAQEAGPDTPGAAAAKGRTAARAPEDGDPQEWLPTDGDGEDGEDTGPQRELRSVLGLVEELRAEPSLDGLRVEVLHGRMAPEDKDAVMQAFAAGDVDVLVSTTVIEVGVDVPNATVMVVMDAERFGVSQLHQLRGRVGRGAAPGLCLLMTETEPGPSLERLEAVAATTDGFALARLDLEQRREGDVLGARQSGGRSQLRLLRLLRDEDLILQAREDAFAVVSEDPALERHPVLRELVASALDEEQAAHLERG